jgi:hypothetical protein
LRNSFTKPKVCCRRLSQSFHCPKSNFACPDFASQVPCRARPSAAILDVNRANGRLKRYYQLPRPVLHPRACDVVIVPEQKATTPVARRSTLSEKRRIRLRRAPRKKTTGIAEGTNPRYKGTALGTRNNSAAVDKCRLDEILPKQTEEEDSESDEDFADGSGSGESSNRYDEDD